MFTFLRKKVPISIVVIAYNREKYIHECMNSILSQEIAKEIICIDDCSTDNTYNILQEYTKKYKEVAVYQNKENSGTVFSRYRGLSLCNGEYMMFVDADDALLSNSLKKLYQEACDAQIDILEFSTQTDGDDEFKKRLKKSNCIISKTPIQAYADKEITNLIPNKFISRNVYKKALENMDMSQKQENFSDVVYFLYHFLLNAKTIATTETEGYFYYDKRGMTANLSTLNRLKQFCGFRVTKNELEKIYGKMPELSNTWNYVCNQAVCTFLELTEEEQEKHMQDLYRLMSEKNAKFLIEGHKKLRKGIQ